MAGLSVSRYLHTDDIFEKRMLEMIATRWIVMQREMDLNRATMIANAVIKGLGGK
jgi:hypothetical protein